MGHFMKRITMVAAALFLTASAAKSADIEPRSYQPVVAAPINIWTGFYIGAVGGYMQDTDSTRTNIKGGYGGGTIGYNWQNGALVLGIEADGAGASVKDSASLFGIITAEDKIRALGSVRGRIGAAFDTVLIYATGGYGAADNQISFTGPGGRVSDSKIHSGFVAGGGIEWMFIPKWSLKVEYLYRDFQSQNYFATLVPGGVATGNIQFHSGQIGINYHF